MAVLIVAVVCFVAPRSAGAEQIPTARTQIAALEAQASSAAGHVRDLTLSYQQHSTTAAALAEQVSVDQTEITRLQGQAAVTREALQQEAILSYTGGATGSTDSAAFLSASDPAVRAEYLQIAAGDMSNTIDQYRTEEAQVSTAEGTLNSQLRASQEAAAAAIAARDDALVEAAAVQSQLDQAQSQLQRLEAQAAAARAAQAQVQGLPVGGGLVSVVRSVVSSTAPSGGVWLELRQCESGNNYRANTGNGFYGAYQFSASTWSNLGYPGRPDIEPPAMQDQAAQRLESQSGWGQWPACSAALGLS